MELNLINEHINNIVNKPFYNACVESNKFDLLIYRALSEIKFIFQDKRLNKYNEFKYVTFRSEKINEINYIDESYCFDDIETNIGSSIGVERKIKYFNNPIECYMMIKTYNNVPEHLKNKFSFYELYGKKYYIDKKELKEECNNLYNIFFRRVYKQYTQNTDVVNRFKNQILYNY